MCAVGDIIFVKSYITPDGKVMKGHSFIVIEDERGNIGGMVYDFVANVMSSIKDEEQKSKKLSFDENMLITSENRDVRNDNGKEAFIKADQLYYFDKGKIDYRVIGVVTADILEDLYELLEFLEKKGIININTRNLIEA